MVNASEKPQNVELGAMPRAILFAEEIANAVADRLNRRRLGIGESNGERGGNGGARSAVTLETLTVQRGGKAEPELLTPLGWKTARVMGSGVLAKMEITDPRVIAANTYAHYAARVGYVPISDPTAVGGSGRVSDGGAVTRSEDQTRLRALQRVLDGRYALDVVKVRKSGRRPVLLRDAVDMAILGEMTTKAILAHHGWAPNGKTVAALRAAILGALDRMAKKLIDISHGL